MPLGRHRLNLDMVAFRRDVDAGTSILVLAKKYGASRASICRRKAELAGRIARGTTCSGAGHGLAEEDELCFELHIDLPETLLDNVLASLDEEELRAAVKQMEPQDKAHVFQLAMQHRIGQLCKIDSQPQEKSLA